MTLYRPPPAELDVTEAQREHEKQEEAEPMRLQDQYVRNTMRLINALFILLGVTFLVLFFSAYFKG